jgi:hypothetical protein
MRLITVLLFASSIAWADPVPGLPGPDPRLARRAQATRAVGVALAGLGMAAWVASVGLVGAAVSGPLSNGDHSAQYSEGTVAFGLAVTGIPFVAAGVALLVVGGRRLGRIEASPSGAVVRF